MACLVNALLRSRIQVGDRVALVGVGFMGTGLLMLAKLQGPRELIAVDPRPEARARALKLGADAAYAPDEVPDSLLLTKFGEWDSPKGCDVVVEGSGTQAGLTLGGRMVRAHGTLSVMGWHQGGTRQVDAEMWGWKAIDVINAHMRRQADKVESLRIALDLVASGRFSLEPLVSHTFMLDQVDQAFQHLVDKPHGFTKAVILPPA
jgi:threonine dehydrogenase-like Zn-dependent dehydrogenase